MTRRTTLSFLIELQRRERDRVAALAARARREAESATSTLQMLEDYRRDYDTRSPKVARRAFTATSIGVHERFTGKLDRAIDEQGRLRVRLAEASSEREGDLAQGQRRLKALETLHERREADLRLRTRRAEQIQTDEFATQVYLRNRREE
jgi:flagellar FliJ protein